MCRIPVKILRGNPVFVKEICLSYTEMWGETMEEKTIIQKINPICENLPKKMKMVKEQQRKTNQQIIDSTGISESTVKKFFSGHLNGPSIYDVTAIAIDLGLSLDELMELTPPKEDNEDELSKLKIELAHKEELLTEKERIVSVSQERVRAMQRELYHVRRDWRSVAYAASSMAVLLGFFLMVYVVLDARNPNMGLFRRQEISPIVYVAAFSIVLVLFVIARLFIKRKVGDKNADDTH